MPGERAYDCEAHRHAGPHRAVQRVTQGQRTAEEAQESQSRWARARWTRPGCSPHATARADYPPSPAPYLTLLTVWAFIACATPTPAADFCCTVRVNRSTLSHDSVTCSRSPDVSSIAYHTQPPDLPPVPLMDLSAHRSFSPSCMVQALAYLPQ